MKTFLPLAFFVALTLQGYSQSFQLYKIVDPGLGYFYADQGKKVIQTDSFYYIMDVVSLDGFQGVIVKTDKQGIFLKRLDFTSITYNKLVFSSACLTHDGFLLFCGTYIDYFIGAPRTLLAKVDQNLNLQWAKFLTNPNNTSNGTLYGRAIFETDEQQHYVIQTSSFQHSYLYHTDLNGNLVNIHNISDTVNAGGLKKTLDGNLITVGTIEIDSSLVASIIKMDLQANVIWHKPIPKSIAGSQITPLNNGKYAAVLARDTVLNYPYEGIFSSLLIFDENGEIEHEQLFETPYDHQKPLGLITAANGDVIGCGVTDAPVYQKGWLFRATPQGDILWQRFFSDSLKRPWSQLPFYDLAENPDGSIVVSGSVKDSVGGLNPYDPENVNENLVLLVTDANGCLTSDCPEGFQDVTTAVKGINREIHSLEVYPNPAYDLLTIIIPENFQGQNTRVELYDALGRSVLQQNAGSNVASEKIDIQRLKSGYYLLSLRSSDGKFVRQKVVIR